MDDIIFEVIKKNIPRIRETNVLITIDNGIIKITIFGFYVEDPYFSSDACVSIEEDLLFTYGLNAKVTWLDE